MAILKTTLYLILTLILLSGCGDDRLKDKTDMDAQAAMVGDKDGTDTGAKVSDMCIGLSQKECDDMKKKKIPGDTNGNGKCEQGEPCYIAGDDNQDGKCDKGEGCYLEGDNNRNGKCDEGEDCKKTNKQCNPKIMVTFCHKPGTAAEQTLTVDECGWVNGHENHGDILGECADSSLEGDDDGDGKCEKGEKCWKDNGLEGDDDGDGKCEKGEKCWKDDGLEGDDDGDGKCEKGEKCWDEECTDESDECPDLCELTGDCEEEPVDCELDPDTCCETECCEIDCEPAPKTETEIARLSFDEGFGKIAYDRTNFQNNGKIVDAIWTYCAESGMALYFNGSASFVKVYYDASMKVTSYFSLNLFLRREGNGSGEREVIFSNGISEEFLLYYDREKGTLNVKIKDKIHSIKETALTEWTQITLKYDNTSLKLLIDEKAVFEKTVTKISFSESSYYIGGLNGTEAFKGFIDEVKISKK